MGTVIEGARSLCQRTGLLMNALAIVVSVTLLAWPIAATAQVKC
jgi:hypothetical protein